VSNKIKSNSEFPAAVGFTWAAAAMATSVQAHDEVGTCIMLQFT